MIRLAYQRTNGKSKVYESKDFNTADMSLAFQMLRDFCYTNGHRLIPGTITRILPKEEACL